MSNELPTIEIDPSVLLPDLHEAYKNIVEWLYLNDGIYSSVAEWREAFLTKLQHELGFHHEDN